LSGAHTNSNQRSGEHQFAAFFVSAASHLRLLPVLISPPRFRYFTGPVWLI